MIKAIIKLANENIKYVDLMDWNQIERPNDMFARLPGMIGIAYPIMPEDGSKPTEYEMIYTAPENVTLIECNAIEDEEEEEEERAEE